MKEITLKALCYAIMKNGNIFRGSRDDWGAATENLYESLEYLADYFPHEVIKIDNQKRRIRSPKV